MLEHLTTYRELRSRSGSSVAEFVIIAPLLSLLALAAFDLNKRAEDAQNVLLVARNAVYLGDVGGDKGFSRNRALLTMTDYDSAKGRDQGVGGLMDAAERAELQMDPDHTSEADNPARSGTRLVLTGPAAPSDGDLRLMAQPAGIKPVPGTFADGYQAATSALSTALPVVNTAMNAYGAVFQMSGLDPRDNMRTATMEMKLSGSRNAMARSIGLLSDMVGKTGTVPLYRQQSARLSLLGQSAFHSNEYRNSALVGAGLGGLLHDKWGSSGTYSSTSDHLQTRCMSRLSMESSCETASSILPSDREFLFLIQILASAKLTLSGVLAVGTLGLGTAAEEAIYAAIRKGLESFVGSVGDKVVQTGKDMVRDYAGTRITSVQQQLGDSAQQDLISFAKDFIPNTDTVQKVVGE